MSIDINTTDAIPADVLADGEAIIAAIMAGKRPDPEVERRVQERGDKITAEIRRKYGTLNIAVDAIRELRDS